jgi:peroxiredoxin
MKPAKLFAAVAAVAFLAVPAVMAQQTTETKDTQKAHQTQKAEKVQGQPGKVEKAASAAAKVGSQAPEFTLTDTDGKEVKLSSFAGKTVVIEWFNPDCPFVKKYHESNKTMAELNEKYSKQGVVFLAINSGAAGKEGAGKERNAKAKTDWKLAYPILIDDSGRVGREYGAKRTPTIYIVDKNGILAYAGAIDDSKDDVSKVGKTNYIANALDELLAGKAVTTKETEAFGCAVKYGKKN